MKETFGNSRGEGGLFSFTKMEIPERWGDLAGIPSVVGAWIFSGTTQYKYCEILVVVSAVIYTS